MAPNKMVSTAWELIPNSEGKVSQQRGKKLNAGGYKKETHEADSLRGLCINLLSNILWWLLPVWSLYRAYLHRGR